MTLAAQVVHLVAAVVVLLGVASMRDTGASRRVVRVVSWAGFLVAVSGVAALAYLGGWPVTAGAMVAGSVVALGAWQATRKWAHGHGLLLAVAAAGAGAAVMGVLLALTPAASPIPDPDVYAGLVVASVAVAAAVAGAAGASWAVSSGAVGGARWPAVARWVVVVVAVMTVGAVLWVGVGAWWASLVVAVVAVVTGVVLAWSVRLVVARWVPTAGALVCAALMVQGVAVGVAGVVALCGVAAGVCAAVRQRYGGIHDAAAGVARQVTARDAAVLLASARRVVAVPGFEVAAGGGLVHVEGVARALSAQGVEATVVAHSGAGKLPGVMAYLLQELDLTDDQLVVDPLVAGERLAACDVALVVGGDPVQAPAGLDYGAARQVIYLPGTVGNVEGLGAASPVCVVLGDVVAALRDTHRALT